MNAQPTVHGPKTIWVIEVIWNNGNGPTIQGVRGNTIHKRYTYFSEAEYKKQLRHRKADWWEMKNCLLNCYKVDGVALMLDSKDDS